MERRNLKQERKVTPVLGIKNNGTKKTHKLSHSRDSIVTIVALFYEESVRKAHSIVCNIVGDFHLAQYQR